MVQQVSVRPAPLSKGQWLILMRLLSISRLRKNAGTSSFRGAGCAREPESQEHGPDKSIAWPVFMGSGPGPDGPSRNNTRVFQLPVSGSGGWLSHKVESRLWAPSDRR